MNLHLKKEGYEPTSKERKDMNLYLKKGRI